ncbi:MAG: glycosyltransferase family 2 protein [Clostridia bacterium]|nr:glycosyltransferase family 2 protein [Clostridia bacterium]
MKKGEGKMSGTLNPRELLVIVPAFNEEQNIRRVIRDLREQAGVDLLVVDDGSSDGTCAVCRELGVAVARHRVNLGLAEAVRTGIRAALREGYRYVLQFDGDGQHDAAAVADLLRVARETDADIVIGSRYLHWDGGTAGKRAGRRLISLCIRMACGQRIADPTSGMRLMNRRVMEQFTASAFCLPEPDTLAYLIRKGFRVVEIPVTMRERLYGESYLNLPESLRYCFRVMTSILFLQWLR